MFRKLVFASITTIVVLGLTELLARTVEHLCLTGSKDTKSDGWQAEFFTSLFDWHEPDPDLLWRFKPNLEVGYIVTNEDHMIGERVPVKRRPGSFRILLLGDSSPVGLGLTSYRQSFGEVLKSLLADELKRPVELVNAAVAGYTSEQVRRLLELRGWQYQPDLVLVYCGNNDASISGPLTDRELMEAQQFRTLRRVVGKSALYRLLRAAIDAALPNGCGDLAAADLSVRVSPEEYEENLQAIAEQCRNHGCPLVLMRPAVPLKWPAGLQFKVFQQVTGADGDLILPEPMRAALGRQVRYCIDWDDFARRYDDADRFTRAVFGSAFRDSLPPNESIARYRAELSDGSDDPVLMNNLGASYFDAGELDGALFWLSRARIRYQSDLSAKPSPDELSAGSVFFYNEGMTLLTQARTANDSADAAALLDSALAADYFSLRIKPDYIERLDRVAQEDSRIAVCDVGSALSQDSSGPLSAENMFIDHCHPTAKGHWLIARALARLIVDGRLLAQ